jgi:hypothetical protein
MSIKIFFEHRAIKYTPRTQLYSEKKFQQRMRLRRGRRREERLLRRVYWACDPLAIRPGVVVATEPAYTI